MRSIKHWERLAELAKTIEVLTAALIEREQATRDVLVTEAEWVEAHQMETATRFMLEGAVHPRVGGRAEEGVPGPRDARAGPRLRGMRDGMGLPRREGLVTAALLYELASLFRNEADGITRPYAWPPRDPLTADELHEVNRLEGTARAIGYRGNVAAYEEGSS